MMHRPISTAALLAIFAIGCGDRPAPTGPVNGPIDSPSVGISDGSHEINGKRGNEDFFFLPPLVKTPTVATFKDRPFHPALRPRVSICMLELSGAACEGSSVRDFSSSEVAVSLVDEHYHVNWDTKASPLSTGRIYRIGIYVQTRLLGYADVDPVSNGSQLRNVDTDEYIGLVDGRTLPIIFRIEEGALCTFKPCKEVLVTKALGGTFLAADKGAGIAIPANALPLDEVLLTIQRKPVPPGARCVPNPTTPGFVWQQYEGCYEFEAYPALDDPVLIPNPELRGFRQPVVVGVCFTGVPAEYQESIELLKFDDGPGIQRLAGAAAPFIDCTNFAPTPTAPVTMLDATWDGIETFARAIGRAFAPKPLYAVDGGLGCLLPIGSSLSHFFWGLVVTAEKVAGDAQVATVGTSVPIAPELSITTAHADRAGNFHKVNSAPIRFRVASGGGTLVGPAGTASFVDVTSAVKVKVIAEAQVQVPGIATLPDGWSWRLGSEPGPNVLEATGPFVGGTVTFTATGQDAPGSIRFTTLSVGGAYTCAIDANGAAWCWGYNGSTGQPLFQLGIQQTSHTCGSFDCQPAPALVSAPAAGAVTFASLSAGDSHTCALTPGGSAYCWGYNGSGQLGDGTTARTFRPVPVQTTLTFREISAGSSHTCAISTGNELYCWGANGSGQLGVGTTTDHLTPASVAVEGVAGWQSVSGGERHTCALSLAGAAYCWGGNSFGELGTGGAAGRLAPTLVSGTATYTRISAGAHHTCAVSSDRSLRCWGRNDVGQLGTGDTSPSVVPMLVSSASGTEFAGVSTGGFSSCALTSAGTVMCWGRNDTGELGLGAATTGTSCTLLPGGSVPCSKVPVALATTRLFTAVSTGARGDHSCGLRPSGASGHDIYCWGRNGTGQLGTGAAGELSHVPVRVTTP